SLFAFSTGTNGTIHPFPMDVIRYSLNAFYKAVVSQKIQKHQMLDISLWILFLLFPLKESQENN
ncbi:MAG: hypothetical protein ACP5E3_11730, partial [Bacteroidales bacterium]